MAHISNSLGTVNPVAELCARARKLGIITLVDARAERRAIARGRAGHRLRFLRVLRPQNLRADRHRRAVRPAGTARRHAAVSGRRRNDFVRRLSTRRSSSTRRTGSRPARRTFPAPIGLHAAMDYLDAIGRDNIWQHDQELANYAYEKLAALQRHPPLRPETSAAPAW